jgi:hypothetical protein
MQKNFRVIFWAVILIVLLTFATVAISLSDAADQVPTLAPSPVSYGMPAKYPVNVKSMTDKQFFRWATRRNAAATDAWFSEAALSPRYTTGKVLITKGESSTRAIGNSGSTINGYTTLPKNATGSATYETREYSHRYNNPNYSWPGPLTIINPYVRPR